MKVNFLDFKKLHDAEFNKKVSLILNDIIEQNSFVEGEYNFKFEEKFAKMQGSKFCLLTANGTDALEIALKVYGVNQGDHVAVPSITFYASAESIVNIGAIPVFVDIDPSSGLMCPESLKRILESNKNIKAVMPVHIYGLPAPMKEIQSICEQYQIPIVEDAAQAQGGNIHTGPIGSSGNLTTFSFYPTKNLSAFGDAGAILGNDETLYEKIKELRNHGRRSDGLVKISGRNSRCDHLQAAVLYTKLDYIEQWNIARKSIASTYFKLLDPSKIELLPEQFLETSSWHLFPIRVKNLNQKNEILDFLKEKNISAVGNFYDYTLKDLEFLKNYDGEFEKATEFSKKVICLPMHPKLSSKEVQFVAESVNSFFTK